MTAEPPKVSEAGAPSPIEASTFEAMFTQVLHPTGAFADALREIGFDVDRIEPRYTSPTWYAALKVARSHVHPDLPPDEGFRALGRAFIEGYYETLLGKVITAAMPLVGLARTIERLPRIWKSSQPTIVTTITKLETGRWHFSLSDPGLIPDFIAGVLEGGAAPTGKKVSIEVVEAHPTSCVLEIRAL